MANKPHISIDKIVLTIAVDAERQPQVQKRMDDALLQFKDSLETQKPSGRYKTGYRLMTPSGESITVEAQPMREAYNYIRVGYAPSKVGQAGAEILASYLAEILGPYYRELFYGGRLQRIAVSFDIRGATLDDLWVYRVGERDKKTALVLSMDMTLQSLCIGHQSTRYWVFTQHESADIEPCVCAQYIQDKGSYPLSEFYDQLENPLKSITIRRYAPIPEMDEISSRMLFDACRLRGRRQVLAMYPAEEQERMKAVTMRFPMIDEYKLRHGTWAPLRGEIDALLPPCGRDKATSGK